MTTGPSDDVLVHGRRVNGVATVTIGTEALDSDSNLWQTSLCLRNHSPTGPEWGYAGSGPAQLALALLLLVTDSVEAERLHQAFKASVLAGIQTDNWTLRVGGLRTWVANAARERVPLLIRSTTENESGALGIIIASGR